MPPRSTAPPSTTLSEEAIRAGFSAIYTNTFAKRKPHSVFRRGASSKLPSTPAEKAAPLHVSAQVAPMDVPGLIDRLAGGSGSPRERWDYAYNLTFYPPTPPAIRSSHDWSPPCPAIDANKLHECGVAMPAPGPGTFNNVPFSVYESKSGGRRRFILWTRFANSLCDAMGYKAYVPGLQHVSAFLPSALDECGSGRDFKTGFYQIPIPEDARRMFRFCDSEGRWWELTRLPMGHCCSVELMQTLGAAAAGHPSYVKEEFKVRNVKCDLWVDNIRFTGDRSSVREATELLDRTASAHGITWKPEDTFNELREYDFVGIAFDHVRQRVAPSAKVLDKLRALDLSDVTSGAIEALVGRLIHASAITRVYTGSFYTALKWARRVVNGMNSGRIMVTEWVIIPPSIRKELSRWIEVVQVPTQVRPPILDTAYTVFVDASLEGWGGVIVNRHTGLISVSGARFEGRYKGGHINELEAEALARVIQELPADAAGGRVHVVVDNTTVRHVALKGVCTANQMINDSVLCALMRLREMKCAVSLQWLRSAYNPADIPSRVPMSAVQGSTLQKLERQVAAFLLGRPDDT